MNKNLTKKWKTNPLGYFGTILKGKLTAQSEFANPQWMPLINTDALRGSSKIWANPEGAVLCEKNDVLILWDGERSGLVATNMEGVVGSTFGRLRPSIEIDGKFLFYYLYNKFEWIQNRRTGTGVPHAPKDLTKILIVNYPENIEDQQEIAHILTTCDTVISETQSAIAKYKAIKQGMLHDLFTRGLDANGKIRPCYEEAPELYKSSELGMIPKEWESCNMGKYVLNNLYGPRFDAKDYSENGNVKTIRGTDFTKEGEILYEQAPKAILPIILINAHKLNDRDIVMVTTANCGLTAVFKKPVNDVDFIPSAYSVKYRFDKNVNPYFIKYFMGTDKAIRQVNKFVRQGTLGNLPGSDVLRFEMTYPDLIEQDKIVNRLFSLDNKIQTEETFLHKYQSIKQGLMRDLLGGRKNLNTII